MPKVLAEAASLLKLTIDPDQTTYYLGRESVQGGKKGAMGSFAGPPGTPTRRIPMAPGPAEDWSGIAASALLAGRMIPASSNMATRQPRMVFTLAPGQATE